MINFDVLNNGKKMILYINKKEHEINIKIDRYKYTNEDLDITIIEILDNDKIKNFIDIDKFIFSRNYIGANAISVYLNDNDDFELSHTKIIEKINDNYICNIESIKEGILIIKDSMKLLGIIKEKEEKLNIIPMNIIINKINFIKCIFQIKNDDIGKNIQIINNKNQKTMEIKNEEIEKEIKIIINGEIISNTLEYIFNKEGDYIIYLISYNNLTNMSCMFRACTSLKELNLSTFNTNQVANMSDMFWNCTSLKEINLSSFNTNQVTNMSGMFHNCTSLKELNLTSFDTNQVTDMSAMFSECTSLKELNLTSFVTNQVTNMSGMFEYCSSLKKLNLSSFNTNQVTDMYCMFRDCSSLKELNLSSFNSNQVTDLEWMFSNCNKKCKIKCSDEKILKEFKKSTDCNII